MVISAVVVTHNRASSLKICLKKIQSQVHVPDRIIIVDNASTDGTKEMIYRDFPGVECISLSRNYGGAGGYNVGIQYAMVTGSDAVWVMDDDAFAQPDCLSNLIKAMKGFKYDVVGAMVVDIDDPKKLAFPLPYDGGLARRVDGIKHAHTLGIANLFNGVLISWQAVSRAGLPDSRLFIRGDEVEYFLRLRSSGCKIATVKEAVIKHPSGIGEQTPLILGRFIVTYTGNKVKDYCLFRNKAYISKRYFSYAHILIDGLRYFIFFVLKGEFREFTFWKRATWDGIRERFANDF